MQCLGIMVEFATCGGNMHIISEACWFTLYFLLQNIQNSCTPARTNATHQQCTVPPLSMQEYTLYYVNSRINLRAAINANLY